MVSVDAVLRRRSTQIQTASAIEKQSMDHRVIHAEEHTEPIPLKQHAQSLGKKRHLIVDDEAAQESKKRTGKAARPAGRIA